jgi:hypothetical protein
MRANVSAKSLEKNSRFCHQVEFVKRDGTKKRSLVQKDVMAVVVGWWACRRKTSKVEGKEGTERGEKKKKRKVWSKAAPRLFPCSSRRQDKYPDIIKTWQKKIF